MIIFSLFPLLASEEGFASWYGGKFHGRLTANGETFDTYKFTAAHRTLPFNTVVRVTNLKNSKTVEVRINDRGPFVRGRIIDLSKAAAEAIDMTGDGVARVRLDTVQEPAQTAKAKEPSAPAAGPGPAPADPESGGKDSLDHLSAPPEPDTSFLGLESEFPEDKSALKDQPASPSTPAVQTTTETEQKSGLFKIQVAAFSVKGYAVRAKDKLVEHGFSPAFESGGPGIVRIILPNIHEKDVIPTKTRLADIGFHEAFPRKQ